MKKYSLLVLLLTGLLFSCNENDSPVLEFLNTGNLPVQFFDVNTERDTVLHTQKGAEITIPKGSISGSKKTVRLEIREAYSMEDIVKAGLQTKSGNRPLSSGGMINIKATDLQARIMHPVQIRMPSENIEKDMKVFKGVEDKDGNIDWTDPQSPAPNKTLDSIEAGRTIFNNNCSSCHRTLRDATGPPLIFLPQRRDHKWMKRFIHNSAELIASGDPLANCLYEKWNKTVMTAFPDLTDDELGKLYRYLDQESKNLNPADYPDFKASFDSCQAFNKAEADLLSRKGTLIDQNGMEVDYKNIPRDSPNQTLNMRLNFPPNKVAPKAEYSTYHQFDITSFGWYNIDAFIDNVPGYEPSTLKVKLAGNYRELTNIFLIIPSSKIFTYGGLLKDQDEVYGFYTDDGKLPLPQGKEAYIMAFTEKDDQITFGLSRFMTSRNNEVMVTPVIISKEEMNRKIKELKFEDLAIAAKDSRNADSIRKIDVKLKDIESLKPRGTDCHCGWWPVSDSGRSEMDQ